MYEVEVKVRAAHEAIRDRLESAGAEFVGTVRQVDTYYDAPHRDFASTDEALRIRRETRVPGTNGTDGADHERDTRLTYKGPLVEAESKTREEIQVGIESGGDVAAVLEALGFEPAATVRKERDRFEYEGFTVTLDSVDDLGEFVEVETAVETEDAVEPARREAFELLRSLELDPDDQIRTSYLGLLLATSRNE